MANSMGLPQLAWHGKGRQVLDIDFPETWDLEVCNMEGHDRRALSSGEIGNAIRTPISMPPIREAARGKKEVVILFDDMTRVTRAAEIVPFVLEELAQAGIQDNHIRFIAALGNHGTMSRLDFVKKLGEPVVSRFAVFNHNTFGNCTYVGTTTFGTRIHVNAEVMKCDFKIGIGMVVPHRFVGYGGGAKIIFPGVTSFETTAALHNIQIGGETGKPTGFKGKMGSVEESPLRRNVEEAAVLAGLDFKVDALINAWGETVAIYAGSPKAAFDAATAEGESLYRTSTAENCDVVVTNTFAKASEPEGGIGTGFPSLKPEGGDIVLIANIPEGHVIHYLFGSWGKVSGNPFRIVVPLPPNVDHLIFFTEYPDMTIPEYFSPQEKVIMLSKWEDVIRTLQSFHGGKAKVAVYPSSEIQYLVP